MFTMKIKTANAAFREDGLALGAETARILRDVADRAEEGYAGGTILDINGNTVGEWDLS